jgi:hypothetical protein
MTVLRRSMLLVAVAATIGLGAPTAATAAGHPRIGPHQQFIGLVNGSSGVHAHAQVRVACPGPVQDGRTTHPLPHQTLEVTLPPAAGVPVGDTGPRGTHINVYLGIPPSAAGAGGVATFVHYGRSQPIPATLTVPCSGSGYFTFMPFPRDPGKSKAFVVPFDYANIAA